MLHMKSGAVNTDVSAGTISALTGERHNANWFHREVQAVGDRCAHFEAQRP